MTRPDDPTVFDWHNPDYAAVLAKAAEVAANTAQNRETERKAAAAKA